MNGPFKLKYKNSAFPFKSPLKHPKHEDHHPPKEKLSKIAKKTSIGWPKLEDE